MVLSTQFVCCIIGLGMIRLCHSLANTVVLPCFRHTTFNQFRAIVGEYITRSTPSEEQIHKPAMIAFLVAALKYLTSYQRLN